MWEIPSIKYGATNVGDAIFSFGDNDEFVGCYDFVWNWFLPMAEQHGYKLNQTELDEWVNDNYGFGNHAIERHKSNHKADIAEWIMFDILAFLQPLVVDVPEYLWDIKDGHIITVQKSPAY